MGRDSNIEWTHHTFNPWWGCVNVSPACDHCYAENLAKRFGTQWGKDTERRFFGDRHWNEPLKWDVAAQAAGVRQRVFCASMADVFEDRDDLFESRQRLWALTRETPHLDWLLLTKRPWNIPRMFPKDWLHTPQANVWLGTTAENQKWADQRWDALSRCEAVVRFLSCEPLLGPISFEKWGTLPDWIIVGGESGGRSRPMEPAWAQHMRDQCVGSHVPFFFKQWGEHNAGLVKIGKHAAGRTLDGKLWSQVPHPHYQEVM